MGIGSWNRLGEGDSIIAKKMRERREAGVDIDGIVANAFMEGFNEQMSAMRGGEAPPRINSEGIRGLGGIGPHWKPRRTSPAPPTPSEATYVDVVGIERNRKPIAQLLAENPPHPSEN